MFKSKILDHLVFPIENGSANNGLGSIFTLKKRVLSLFWHHLPIDSTSPTIEDSLGYKTSRIETIHILCVGMIQVEYRSKCEKTFWPKKRYFEPFHIESMRSHAGFSIKQTSHLNTSSDIKILAKKHGEKKRLGTHTRLAHTSNYTSFL